MTSSQQVWGGLWDCLALVSASVPYLDATLFLLSQVGEPYILAAFICGSRWKSSHRMKLVATVLSIFLQKDASSSYKFLSKVQESTQQVEAILQALWGCPPHALGCSWGLWRLRPHRNSRGALCPPALKHSIAPSPRPCLGSRGGWKPTTHSPCAAHYFVCFQHSSLKSPF